MESNTIKGKAKIIIERWLSDIIDGSKIDASDNLIEKGLSSIQIMQLSGKLKKNGIIVPFAKLIENPSKEKWFSLVDTAKIKEVNQVKKDSKKISEAFPLTDVQYSYFIGREDDQTLGGIGCHAYLEIDGEGINPDRLNKAWNILQYRHPMLRARFIDDGNQEILEEPYSDSIEIFNLSEKDKKEVEVQLKNIRNNISHRKLKVKEGQVADIKLALLPSGKHRIFFDIDLLVADVMSMSILLRELSEIYAGFEEEKASKYTFADYIYSLESTAEDDTKDKEFWEAKINSFEIERPNLPIKTQPEQIKETRFTRRKRIIDREDWKKIKEIAATYKTTPSMVLLTCYTLVLERWCNQDKFFINIPLFNRDLENENLKNMVADFTTLLLVEHETLKDDSFIETLKRTNKTFLENASHSLYNGVQVQRDISKIQGSSANVAPVVFACNIDYPLETEILRNNLGRIEYMISQTPGVWLDFQSYINDGNLILCWDSVDELFPEGVLDDMFESLNALLKSLTDESSWSNKVDVLPDNQKKIRKQDVEGILPLKFPDETLYDGFVKNVNRNPGKVAVIDSETGEELTYKHLYEMSLKIAHYLIKNGVKKGDYIGITLPRGSRQIVAIFGILFAGAAYVPIGITQPNERRSKIYSQIGIKHIISDLRTSEECSLKEEDVIVLDFDQGISNEGMLEKIVTISPYDSAYIIMTSGTTGVPKGVEIMHTSAINTCVDLNEKYKINDKDTVLMVSAIDFDLSVYDIFGILHAGGTIVTTSEDNYRNPDEWIKLIDAYKVTIWDSVPILFDMLVTMAEGKNMNLPFRVVMLSGDWITINLPERFYKISEYKNSFVVAMGGATEASIWSNHLDVPRIIPKEWISIPYGKSLKNQVYRVVDEIGRICPNYVKGELLIGGVGVAKCYHGDEELTKKKYFEEDGIRWYRTGDNGRTWNDGTIEFLGRKDTQVKIKGHRIELGEIEDAIRKYDGVDKVIVDFVERGWSKHLVAFVKSDLSAYEAVGYSNLINNDFSFIVKPETSLINKTELQNKEIDKIVVKAVIDIFREYDVDFSKGSYSIEEICRIIDCSDSNKVVIEKWIRELEKLNYLISSNGRYKKNESVSELTVNSEYARAIERFAKELEPELLDILKGKKDPIEVFYREDDKFSLSKLVRNLTSYEESIKSIIKTLKNYIEKNSNKKLRVLEYSTRNEEITEELFNECKDFIDEYVYVDNSIYFEKELLSLKENSKFKHVTFKGDLKEALENDYFDIVIALNSIHRSDNPQKKLKALVGLLKPNGLLFGNEINQLNLLPLITANILEKNFETDKEVNIKVNNSEVLYQSATKDLAETNFNTFFIRKLQSSVVSFDNLRDYLLKEVPSYMVPTHFYHVDEIPLNKNGKADRKRLKKNLYKDQESLKTSTEAKTQARSDREELLLNIWKESLNKEDIGINDNYFSLGGDSLVATTIVGKVRNKLGIVISIKDIFENSSVVSLSKYIDENKTDGNGNNFQSIVPDKENLYKPFPLTDVQMAYWIGRQGVFDLGNVSTHCYFEFNCLDLNIKKLQKSLNESIVYNPALRTIILKSGEQQILKETPYVLVDVNDVSELRNKDREDALLKIRENLSHRVIDLSVFPTIDFKVAKLTENEFRVFIGIDNTILDGWSMFEFLREIKLRYEGRFIEEKIEITFRDYVLNKKQENKRNYEEDKAYWLNRLDSFPHVPNLSFMNKENSNIVQKFNRKEAVIEEEVWSDVKSIAIKNDLTPTSLLLTLFSLILNKYSDDEKFAINVTQFMKEEIHPQIHKIMGDFTELNLLEVQLDKKNTIIENAKKLQNQLISDREHSSYSSLEFLRELRNDKQLDIVAPIVFTSGLGIMENESKEFLATYNYGISQTPQIWLDHQVLEIDGKLLLVWDYVKELFDSAQLNNCFVDYVNMVKEFSINKEKQIKDFTKLNGNLQLNNERKNDKNEKRTEFGHIEENSNEKIDTDKTNDKHSYSAELEEEIKDLWREVLELEEIGIEDNFFSLGGNSLNMIQLSNKMLEKYNYQLDFSEFLENSTVYYTLLKVDEYLRKI